MFSEIQNKAKELKAKYDLLQSQIRTEKQEYEKANQNVTTLSDAQTILQTIAQSIQEQAHIRISGLVSRCLTLIFDNAPEFEIIFDRKRGKTEARLTFIKNGVELDPKEECSGGMIEVAAFALRLACLILTKPKKRKFLIMDEPFKFLHSEEYKLRLQAMLLKLSKELKIQIVMVTNIPELQTGKVIAL